jgi:pimeloyl-ACP methyl ester carboxylesterase
MIRRHRKLLSIIGILTLVGLAILVSQLPLIASRLILHPFKRPVISSPPPGCKAVAIQGEGITLQGWRGETTGTFRGTMIYLHGVADNRTSGAGVMERFQKRGFDVIAYDSRAHGESGGNACTYGYFEKLDLRKVLETVRSGPVVLIGSSLGAAVALQLAAEEPRVSAVISAESFSDLRAVATDRVPFFFTSGMIENSFKLAEQEGHFQIDTASPLLAAKSIEAPVLIIHGAADVDTRPDHAYRIFDALSCPKRLMLVPGAAHNQSLNSGDVWSDIEGWIDSVVP